MGPSGEYTVIFPTVSGFEMNNVLGADLRSIASVGLFLVSKIHASEKAALREVVQSTSTSSELRFAPICLFHFQSVLSNTCCVKQRFLSLR